MQALCYAVNLHIEKMTTIVYIIIQNKLHVDGECPSLISFFTAGKYNWHQLKLIKYLEYKYLSFSSIMAMERYTKHKVRTVQNTQANKNRKQYS